MGQKSNPIVLRLLITRTWSIDCPPCSRNEFVDFFTKAYKLRAKLMDQLKKAGVSDIRISRPNKKCQISIYAARPGFIIGKKGEDIEKLKKMSSVFMGTEVTLNIVEIKTPQLDANLIANEIAQAIVRRTPHRHLVKKYMQAAMRAGAKGIAVSFSGRRGGAEVASYERMVEGSVPRNTLRADIDHGLAEAMTTFGVCGISVDIYKSDVVDGEFPWINPRRQETAGSGNTSGRNRKSKNVVGSLEEEGDGYATA